MVRFGPPSYADVVRDLRSRDFPGIAETEPFVCEFNLPPVMYLLIKDAEFITDSVADRRNREGCKGIKKTGGKPAKAPIAKTRLLLLIEDAVEVETKLRNRLTHLIINSEVHHGVAEVGSHEIFC